MNRLREFLKQVHWVSVAVVLLSLAVVGVLIFGSTAVAGVLALLTIAGAVLATKEV